MFRFTVLIVEAIRVGVDTRSNALMLDASRVSVEMRPRFCTRVVTTAPDDTIF